MDQYSKGRSGKLKRPTCQTCTPTIEQTHTYNLISFLSHLDGASCTLVDQNTIRDFSLSKRRLQPSVSTLLRGTQPFSLIIKQNTKQMQPLPNHITGYETKYMRVVLISL